MNDPLILYYTMTEMLADHRSTRGGVYPEKFVLNPMQHSEYLRSVHLLSQVLGKNIDPTSHMGIPIEINETSPSVMVCADGSEISLR